MTNGIRASGFSYMSPAASVTAHSMYPIQNPNPNFYHPYQYPSLVTPLYTPPPTPTYQYTPAPTPPHVYHHIQPPTEPPYYLYTTPETTYVTTSPMLISDTTKCFLHQMDSKITQLDDKINQMRVLIEERQRSLFKDEETVTACEVSNSCPVGDVGIKMEDKMTQIIQILEKMGKSCEKSSKLVNKAILGKEVEADVSKLVKDDVLETIEDCEKSTLQKQSKETGSNMAKLLPAIPVRKVLDDYSERVFFRKAPVLMSRECVRFTFYNLREDECGKVHVVAGSSKHIYDSLFLDKGIGFVISWNCLCCDGNSCKIVCLDYISGQFDKVPRKELINWNVFFQFAIKKFMLKELFHWSCNKCRTNVHGVDCFTSPTMWFAYIRYMALLKGREIRACSPRYGLTCLYIKYEIGNSAAGLFEILPLGKVITWIKLRISCVAFQFLYQVVRCSDRILQECPVIYKTLAVELRSCGRGSMPLDFFSAMLGKVTTFSVTIIVIACELFPETRISEMIQGIIIEVVVGSEECTESALVKAYSESGQSEYTTWPTSF
ncbi:uncharacterized protein LOC141670853 [Apium graveolens]|uniref:uncharacterized protein LOC141670853 n=1 Tax=Apium graveolens TaxID=4045 RepID=UPI003D7A6A68